MILNIETPADRPPPFALFQLGFRPFFLGAAGYGVIAVLVWLLIYNLQVRPEMIHLWQNPFWWHGHEMVFGYAMAVVAGFLLTATMNWTGVQTLRNRPLVILALGWLLARVLPWISVVPLMVTALFDLLFLLALTIAVTCPLYKARQWDQIRIFTSKLGLIFLCNLTFYLGLFDVIEHGERIGLYGGIYLILALILTLGRRVFPFFIERGIAVSNPDHPVVLKNSKFLDLSSLVLFLTLAIVDLFASHGVAIALLAASLVVIHTVRFINWYTPQIWNNSLLWVLMVGYGWLIAGFLFKALSVTGLVSPMVALHAFTYGAIGTVTIGMMARVTLGHTGRNVFDPPEGLHWMFALMTIGTAVRVLLPMVLPTYQMSLMLISQLLWVGAFLLFLLRFAPMLIRPRVDGRPG